jgi:uncharacterized protein (TIGR00255 family)
MIRSMTAFALREQSSPFGQLACELRSVNHRYLELALRLPEELRALEPKLREAVASRVARGKVDAGVRFRAPEGGSGSLQLNENLVGELARLANELKKHAPDLAPGTRFEMLAWPGLIMEPERDVAGLHDAVLSLFEQALDDFVETREREGERLRVGMLDRLDAIEKITTQVREWLPEIRAALRLRLETKLADLKQPLDPGRLEQEIMLNVQKLDVDEELDRFASHIAEARRILSRKEAAGRRFDFLLQEFNREANTLGSKSVDARTTQASVELKVLIEQLREQVQNIE